jgi:hypothetical protein
MPSRFPVLRHVLVKMTLFRDSVTMPREGARRKAAIFDSIKSFVLDYYRFGMRMVRSPKEEKHPSNE